MHIPDGIVPIGVAVAGYAVTGAATWYSLRKINQADDPREYVPKAALLTAAFFVASWIHIPIPPTSVHLILNGLMGVMLGFFAFPAILIGLIFQAVLFGHGGITTLGVNAAMIGIPALLAHGIFQMRHLASFGSEEVRSGIFGFVGGATAMGLSVLIFFALMVMTMPADINAEIERAAISALSIAHLPVMLIEGALTARLVTFLLRVKPTLLGGMSEARA
ncbi:MAG: cobalt transporter CbiM [Chloroflexota bacterium]